MPRELSFTERRDWLRLIRTQNVGPVSFRDLINRYGDASAALEALPSFIRNKPIHPPRPDQVEAEMDHAEQMGVKLICAIEPDYPNYLRALDPPPPVISVLGHFEVLHTARYALEQNREVMAAPGSPLDPRTKGCNRLIRQGAHLIESVDDVIAVLETLRPLDMEESKERFQSVPFDARRAEAEITKAKRRVAELLSPTPTPRDDLIRAAKLPIQIVTAALLEMELAGQVHVEPDGKVSRF